MNRGLELLRSSAGELPRRFRDILWATFPASFLSARPSRDGNRFRMDVTVPGRVEVLAAPADVGAVFTADPSAVQGWQHNTVLRPVVGDTSVLVLPEGAEHLDARRRFARLLSKRALSQIEEEGRAIAEEHMAAWPVERPFSLLPRLERVSLDTLLHGIFGDGRRDPGLVPALSSDLRRSVRWTASPHQRREIWPAFQQWRTRADATFDDARGIFADGLQDDPDTRRTHDLLATLLVTGHENVAVGAAWAIERMLTAPSAVREEAVHAARAGDVDYLDRCVRESLRMRPVIPLIVRDVLQRIELPHGEVLPGRIAMCSYVTHHGDQYAHPDVFDPDRFLDPHPAPGSWFPFGGGRRKCLGATLAMIEIRIVLERFLLHYSGELQGLFSGYPVRHSISLVPARGPRVILRRQGPSRGSSALAP